MKYFIDCGGHHGEGLKSFIEMYNIDETWKVFSFEPNKDSFDILKDFKYNRCNIEFINAGIWISNSKLTFNVETTSPSYGSKEDGAGSTFVDLKNWNVKHTGNMGVGDYISSYEVDVINFSDFLKSLKDVEFLLVKMDVEGSEYDILRNIINDDSISVINDLYVEFHDWAMSSESSLTTNNLITIISDKGINIKRWI
jgi:FkbM family methyltransferase